VNTYLGITEETAVFASDPQSISSSNAVIRPVALATCLCRVGHGLGPSMGWVGLGQSFFLIFGGLGWVQTPVITGCR